MFGVLENLMNFITGVFSGDWNRAWSSIGGVFGSIWEGIKNVFKTVLNTIIDFANKMISGIWPVLSRLANALSGVAGWIGGLFGQNWGFSLPEKPPTIPRLAQGGYLEANTPRLAIVGDNKREGEIIAPESKIAEAVAAGMSAVLSRIRQNPPEAGGNWVIQLVDTRGQVTSETVISSLQRKNTRDGRTVIPIGL